MKIAKTNFHHKTRLVKQSYHQNQKNNEIPTKTTKANNKRRAVHKLYAEVCVFQDLGSICTLNERDCEVSTSDSFSANKVYHVKYVLDTGVRLNLIREDFLQTE